VTAAPWWCRSLKVESNADERFGDAPNEPGGLKAEYQSTATKMAMPLKETPQAITVITRDALDARMSKDIFTALELSAGASEGGSVGAPGPFAGRGQFGHMYTLRGKNLRYYGGVLSDGYIASSFAKLDFSAYERIEVIKGPSGFYGQGSLGGFINLVRKKPENEFAAELSTQIGSYDTYRLEGDLTGALNTDKTAAGRVSIAYEDSGSFTDGLTHEMFQIAPSVEFQISDKTRALVQLLCRKDEYIASQGIPLQYENGRIDTFNIPRSFYFGVPGELSNDEVFDALIKVDHELSDSWLLSLFMQRNLSSRDVVFSNTGSQYYGSTYLYGIEHLSDYDRWAGEVRVEGAFKAFGQEHRALFGAQQTRTDLDILYTAVYLGIADSLYADNFADFGVLSSQEIPDNEYLDSTTEQKAIYAQSLLSLTDRTQLLINSRYDWVETTGSFLGSASDPLDKGALTARLSVTHKINENTSAYATVGESFDPADSTGKDGNVLDPTTGVGYELGVKSEWFNKKLGANIAVYRQDLDNRPIDDPDGGLFKISAGLHRTDGIELEIAGSPLPGWQVGVAADWSSNEFIDPDDPNYGQSLHGSTDKRFTLYTHYEFQKDALSGLGLGATFVSVGDRAMRNQTHLEGYERVDLNLSYRGIPDWDFSMLVRNVLDETYIEGTGGNPAVGSYFGSPRAALFEATYRFD